MNKKKWKTKFEGRDSRRFLRRHRPYYGDKYRFGAMPPTEQWMPKAKAIYAARERDAAEYRKRLERLGFHGRVEDSVAGLDASELGRRVKAMAEARKEAAQNGWPTDGLEFLRAVAWHMGFHYNHVGRNYFGHSRRDNGLRR